MPNENTAAVNNGTTQVTAMTQAPAQATPVVVKEDRKGKIVSAIVGALTGFALGALTVIGVNKLTEDSGSNDD